MGMGYKTPSNSKLVRVLFVILFMWVAITYMQGIMYQEILDDVGYYSKDMSDMRAKCKQIKFEGGECNIKLNPTMEISRKID